MKTVKVIAVLALAAFGLTSCSNNNSETTVEATDSTAVVTDSVSTDTTSVISVTNDTDTTIVSQ